MASAACPAVPVPQGGSYSHPSQGQRQHLRDSGWNYFLAASWWEQRAFLCQPVRTKFFTKSHTISCKAQAVFQDRVSAGIERFRLWLPGVGAKRLWSLMWVTANAPQSWAHTWWGKSQVAGPPFWVVIPSLPHAQTLKAPELWIIDAGTGIIP